jgi:hypothetical protein
VVVSWAYLAVGCCHEVGRGGQAGDVGTQFEHPGDTHSAGGGVGAWGGGGEGGEGGGGGTTGTRGREGETEEGGRWETLVSVGAGHGGGVRLLHRRADLGTDHIQVHHAAFAIAWADCRDMHGLAYGLWKGAYCCSPALWQRCAR